MGAACNCSKTNDKVKDVVSLTSPTVALSQTTEEDLATYKRKNAGTMHTKVLALYSAAITQLPVGLSDLTLSACKAKDWTHLFHLFVHLFNWSKGLQRLAL